MQEPSTELGNKQTFDKLQDPRVYFFFSLSLLFSVLVHLLIISGTKEKPESRKFRKSKEQDKTRGGRKGKINTIQVFLFSQLKGRLYREKNPRGLPPVGPLPQLVETAIVQPIWGRKPGASSFLTHEGRGPKFFHCYPRPQRGSWIRSATASTQTGTDFVCQHCRQIIMLHHLTGPSTILNNAMKGAEMGPVYQLFQKIGKIILCPLQLLSLHVNQQITRKTEETWLIPARC